MSVIVELRVDGEDFPLGRLDPPADTQVEFGPLGGEETVPLWVSGWAGDARKALASHDAVEDVRSVERFEDRTLYTLDWDGDGRLLTAADDAGAELLECRSTADDWRVGLRFPDERSLSRFTDWCSDEGVELAVERRYEPASEPSYDLTDRQRATLARAVESGYYDIPRTTTTQELADEIGVSDQAVTERLRRAITSLVEGTLLSEDR